MKTALGFCDDENFDGRVPFEWPIQPPPTTSTTRVWEWDGPTINWSAALSAGSILDWQEERRGR